MDGAGAWRRFRTVTWPALRPIALAVTALNFIWNFNSFALVFVLTDGGPGGRTRLPMLFAYEEAFRYGQFGYAATMGLAMVAVISVLLALYLVGRLKGTTTGERHRTGRRQPPQKRPARRYKRPHPTT